MAKLRYIPLLMSVGLTLACGAQAGLPGATLPEATEASYTAEPLSVEMVITGDLNIRTLPGAWHPLIEGDATLEAGEVVTCTTFYVVGDSLWCKHERGWSNASWMTGYNTDRRK